VADQARPKRPLWICPACGRSFVTPRMAHSCARWTVDDFFAGRDPAARELFDALVAFTRRAGEFVVDPNKTRIAFQNRGRFAGVSRVRRDGLVVTFWLKRRVDSARLLRVDHYPPRDYVHTLLVSGTGDLDAELEGWLAEAWRVGAQEPT
jgi:hypothetical protein